MHYPQNIYHRSLKLSLSHKFILISHFQQIPSHIIFELKSTSSRTCSSPSCRIRLTVSSVKLFISCADVSPVIFYSYFTLKWTFTHRDVLIISVKRPTFTKFLSSVFLRYKLMWFPDFFQPEKQSHVTRLQPSTRALKRNGQSALGRCVMWSRTGSSALHCSKVQNMAASESRWLVEKSDCYAKTVRRFREILLEMK